jgi:asparagine synthase (glutamine-hydrolysing)
MSHPQHEGTAMVPPVRVVVGARRTWSAVGDSRATGFAFRGDEMLRSEQLAATIEGTQSEALPALLDQLTGSFAVVKETPDAVHAMVDEIRGIPLYCIEDDGARVVTDDPLHAVPGLRGRGCRWERKAELLKSTTVSGTDTLLDGVHAAEAGSGLRVPTDLAQPVRSAPWYSFRSSLDPNTSADLVELGYEAHRAAVARTLRFAGNAQVVVPLSGGLDSGILAAILSRGGLDVERDQILTYTFGRPGNRESEVSRRVAETLGLRWEFVEYSEETWKRLAGEPWWHEYLATASSLAGVPGYDDLPAIMELRDRGAVADGSVVVPGHTLGFISGSFIPGSLLRRRRGSRADLIDAVLATYYKYRDDRVLAGLTGRRENDVTDAIRERADRSLRETPTPMSRAHLVSAADEWGWKERQAKMIANSVRVYEEQDLRWALPWWDREVLDFWARAPLRQRVGQRLRRAIAERVEWPTTSRSLLDSLETLLDRSVRIASLDLPAKKLRNAARRASKRNRYHGDPLACLALFGEDRFLQSFHGTETPRALLAEDVLRSLDL